MKQKRLIIIFSIFIVAVLLIVLNSTVFTLQTATLYFKSEEDKLIETPDRFKGIDYNKLIETSKGSNIFFFSESKLISEIEKGFPYMNVVNITRTFPNRACIYAVERTPILKFNLSGNIVVCDNEGYILPLDTIENGIALMTVNGVVADDVQNSTECSEIVFNETKAAKLQLIKEIISSIWQLQYSYSQIPITFSELTLVADEQDIHLQTTMGAVIVIKYTDTELFKKIKISLEAFNASSDNQKAGTLITVSDINIGAVIKKS